MRTASWFRSPWSGIDRIQGRGARSMLPPLAGSPQIVSALLVAGRDRGGCAVPDAAEPAAVLGAVKEWAWKC